MGGSRLLTEVDDQGSVTRELASDAEAQHRPPRYPGEPRRAEYGVFDLAKIGTSERVAMEAEQFERLWSAFRPK